MTINNDILRIGAFSGYTGDRYDALLKQAKTDCPVLFGDYLAEMNLAWRALEIKEHPELGYERPFLAHLKLALSGAGASLRGKKIITNAGALNPKGCAEAVAQILKEAGVDMKIAYTTGDDLMGTLSSLTEQGETFGHLEDGKPLSEWNLTPLTANAYVGARGIRAALEAGADIVITGRVTDASPVIGAAAWWHKWEWDAYDALAGALLAGHCIECGAYVTGGNTSGFLAYKDKYYGFTMGIAEIARDGKFVITREPGYNGVVNSVTVRSQILYEIQGNVYLNPDVQALIEDITVTDEGPDRVSVTGVRGIAPPETTKAAICAVAGWQAETMVFATGLDIEEKFETVRLQVRQTLGDKIKKFSTLDMTQYGVCETNPSSEARSTGMLRIFAQAPTKDAFPNGSLMGLGSIEGLGHFPGFHSWMDFRSCEPKPYIEYWPGRVRQSSVPVRVHFIGSEDTIAVDPPKNTVAIQPQQDYDSQVTLKSGEYGPTKAVPLGYVVHARSGDKGGNANVGFFVRSADEYDWLRGLLTKAKLIELLGADYDNYRIERVEFPGMLAVHFVVHDYLGKGVSSTARLDCLGKGLAEYLRAKWVDVPDKFLARGKI